MVKIMSNPEANCTMPASVVVESSPAGAVEVVSTGGSVPSRIQIKFQFHGKTNRKCRELVSIIRTNFQLASPLIHM